MSEKLIKTFSVVDNPILDLSNLIQEIFKALFKEANNDGNTIINFCLKRQMILPYL